MWGAVSAGLKLAGVIADKLFPEEGDRSAATAKVLDAMVQVDLAQVGINTTECAHRSIWVAGWRPAIGWTCASALFAQFALFPVVGWTFVALGISLPAFPDFDPVLWELMAGMLGIAGLRTFEKYKGVSK